MPQLPLETPVPISGQLKDYNIQNTYMAHKQKRQFKEIIALSCCSLFDLHMDPCALIKEKPEINYYLFSVSSGSTELDYGREKEKPQTPFKTFFLKKKTIY